MLFFHHPIFKPCTNTIVPAYLSANRICQPAKRAHQQQNHHLPACLPSCLLVSQFVNMSACLLPFPLLISIARPRPSTRPAPCRSVCLFVHLPTPCPSNPPAYLHVGCISICPFVHPTDRLPARLPGLLARWRTVARADVPDWTAFQKRVIGPFSWYCIFIAHGRNSVPRVNKEKGATGSLQQFP